MASLNSISNVKEEIEKCLKNVDNLIKNRAHHSEIEASFKSVKERIEAFEDEEELHGYCKYHYHSKLYLYFHSVKKFEEANKNLNISQRFEKYSQLNKIYDDESKLMSDDFVEYNDDKQIEDATNEELKHKLDCFIGSAEEFTIDSEKVFNKHALIHLKNFLDDFIHFKPITFNDYLKLNSMKLQLESLFDDIDMQLQEYSKMTNVDKLLTDFTFIKLYLINVSLLKCRINFMKSILESTNQIDLLFNCEMVEDNINRMYRQLSIHFHPDKVIDWLPIEHIDLANEFFCCISKIRDKLLKKHSKSNLNEYLREANKYWTMSKDYKNIFKGNHDKLQILDKNEIMHLTEDDLRERRRYCLNTACAQYKAACKLADDSNKVHDQVKIRGYISLVFYELGNDLLVSQLYALASLRLILKNSNIFTEKDLSYARNIYTKVTTTITADTNENNEKENNTKDVLLKENKVSLMIFNECSTVTDKFLATKFSYEERQKFDNSINNKLSIAIANVILKSDREIVKYQTSREEILRAKLQATRHKIAATGLVASTAFVGGYAISTGIGSISNVGTVIASGPIGWGVFGVFLVGSGLFAGLSLLKKGNEILKEPQIREKLNGLLENALKFFDDNKYDNFLKELMKEYTKGKKLINLESSHKSINSEELISTLLGHGFRPDGIAYLLNLIGEALTSAKITFLTNFSTDDLKHEALKVFDATLDESLVKEAETLDRRIKLLRMQNVKLLGQICLSRLENVFQEIIIFGTSLKDFVSSRNYTSIAREHLNDSKSMSFRYRLEEMRNIARLNKAILRLLKNYDDEVKLAENDIKNVRESILKNHQFVGKAALRLDAVEDFFWIISARTIEILSPLLTNQHENNLDISHLNEELKKAKKASEKCTVILKKADYYEKQAKLNEKINKIESLKCYKEALENFDDALCIEKLNIDAGIGYARCLSRLSRFSKLIEYLKQNEHLSEIPQYWLLVSLAHVKITKYDEARHYITQALNELKYEPNKEIIKQDKVIARLENTGLRQRLENYKNTTVTEDESWFNNKRKLNSYYNILSIDGGGVRGVIPAIWLCEIEKQTRRPISHLFNMMSGTSIGAVIVALLSVPKRESIYLGDNTMEIFSKWIPEYSASSVVQVFTQESSNIFSNNERNFLDSLLGTNLSTDKYSGEGRSKVLNKYLSGYTLDDVLNDFVVPAVNQNDMLNTHIFNRYDVRKNLSKNESLFNVLMASTAAPSYFPIHEIKNKGSFIDGGIHLNNPAMAAYTEALRYHITKENIFVLSLGTGSYILDPFQPELCQGQLFWAQNFHRISLACQEWNVDRDIDQILNNKYERWQVSLGKSVALDDYQQMDYLGELACQYIEELYESDENKMNKLIEHLIKEN